MANRQQARYVAAHVLTKLGDRGADAKTMLTAVVQLSGAPTWVSGLLVPLRESGSMLLQPMLGRMLMGMGASRVWLVGALVQGLSVALMALVLWNLEGLSAGLTLLLLMALFALARSLCSLAGKQVLARIAEKGSRGRLSGRAASISGALVLLIAAAALASPFELSAAVLGGILLLAGLAWMLAAWIFPRPNDENTAAPDSKPAATGFARSWALLRSDRQLRRFVYSRGLLISSSLSGPYFLLLDRRDGALSSAQLAGYVLAGALASMLSALLWGRAADRSSRLVMAGAGLLAALPVLLVGMFALQWLPRPELGYLYPLAFLWLSLAHEGVRMGRKIFVVDIADDAQQRADYVATSNAGIGLLLLVAGGLSAALAEYSVGATLVGLAGCGLLGVLSSFRLPEVSAD